MFALLDLEIMVDCFRKNQKNIRFSYTPGAAQGCLYQIVLQRSFLIYFYFLKGQGYNFVRASITGHLKKKKEKVHPANLFQYSLCIFSSP